MKTAKRIIVALLMLVSFVSVNGQTQSGYVRTAGRPDNREGTRVGGVEIRFRGKHNPVVCDRKGMFKVDLGGGAVSYVITGVSREGYELQEKELIGRTEPVSESVPKEIVMVSLKEKRLIEKRVREQVERRYQEKLDRLQSELNDKSISEERYKAEVQRLNDEYDMRDRLVNDMVERYVRSDYATMSAKEAEINAYIENGELERADSVINSLNISKLESDRNSLIMDIRTKESQIANERAAVKSIDSTLWMAYRGKADIFFADFQNDSVVYYLEKMLTIDTANVGLMIEIGSHYDYYMADKERSLYYLNRARKLLNGDSTLTFLTICMNDIGTCYYDFGKLDSMKIYLDEALRLSRIQGDKLREALALSNLSLYYDKMSDRENQKRSIEEAMDIYVALYGKKNEHSIVLLNSMGSMMINTNRYREAIKYINEAMGVMRKGKDIYDRLWPCYNNMGNAYGLLGVLDSAEYWYGKAMEMVVQVYGENHPNVATVLGNISALKNTRGEYREAIALRKRSLDINTAFYKDYHRAIAIDLANLSTLYGRMEQSDSSLFYALEAMRIYNVIDSTNPGLIVVYSNIGGMLANKGQLNMALEYFIKADNIAEMYPGQNKNSVSSLYLEIGNLFSYAGMNEKALAYYEESLKLLDEIYGADNTHYIALLNNMGVQYSRMKEYEKCFAMHRRVGRILEKDGMGETMKAASHYMTYATELYEAGVNDSVEYLFKRAYRIVKREVGDTSIRAIPALSNLAEVYHSMGIYDSALIYAHKQCDIYTRWQKYEDNDYNSVCLMISTILHRLGRLDECAEFMADKAYVLDVAPDGPMASRGYEGRYYLLGWKAWNYSDSIEFYNTYMTDVPVVNVVVYRDGKVYSESFEGRVGVNVRMTFVGREKREEITKAYNERR